MYSVINGHGRVCRTTNSVSKQENFGSPARVKKETGHFINQALQMQFRFGSTTANSKSKTNNTFQLGVYEGVAYAQCVDHGKKILHFRCNGKAESLAMVGEAGKKKIRILVVV